MNWTRILRDGGVPEPPGREEALMPVQQMFRATLRRKKGGATVSETIEAPSYHVALAQVRQRFKDCTFVSLINGKDFDRRHRDDGSRPFDWEAG
jgi:hypothetical protein